MTEMLYKKNPKLLNQFQYSEREGVPLLVILGEEETARGGVKIRDTRTRQDEFVEMARLVPELKKRLSETQ
jgi:histidyl-tRNA synthetase